MTKLLRILLGIIAAIMLVNAGFLWAFSNFNLGLILLTAIGFFLLLYALFFHGINQLLDNKVGKYLKFLVFLAVAVFTFTATLITMSASNDTVNYKEDAIIVLGAGVHGTRVSRPLAFRLNTAISYHAKNPEALIIVTGGQGPQEEISEALAMERYLIDKGVNPEQIVREEKATSTYENFLYSKDILTERFPGGYRVAYITNSFHIYRAGRLAKSAGVISARMHADTDILTLLPDYLRESCAVAAMWITGK